MRYLKNFNEGGMSRPRPSYTNSSTRVKKDFELELREFCNNYLSYLKDMGLNIKVDYLRYKSIARKYEISISKPRDLNLGGSKHDDFNYDDIKDDFIQFVKMLDKNYKISDNSIICCSGLKRFSIKVDELEKFNISNTIYELSIIVETMSHREK